MVLKMDMNAINERQIGVTFGFRAKAGYYESEMAKTEANAIAASGIKWVTLVATVFQENYAASFQFMDFELTPTDLELVDMINYLHSLGIKVQLRPMLEGLDGSDRIDTWFPYDCSTRIPGCATDHCAKWFKSMKARTVHYAKIAERTGCELFCLDSELDRIVHFSGEWKEIIKAAREVYSGPITSCHTCYLGHIDFEAVVKNKNHWFYDLDMLSLSCYYKAADKPGTTLAEMKAAFVPLRDKLRKVANEYGKPILFGEVGCTSCEGGAMSPNGWRGTTPKYDGAEQANYLEAFVETFKNEPWWRGICWWKWDEQLERPFLDSDPAGNCGFTPKGKPAIELFRKYNSELSKR